MTSGRVRIGGLSLPVHSLNTLVIGSGAAGLNAAVRLHELGQTDVAVLTERLGAGASAESGSDKQTYYKLSLAGDTPDSAAAMARDLAAGGSMHGDIALAEAQGSLEAFFRLVALGVPFPFDRYGAYVGYKTDHDPRQRATSAGPLTSRLMFEALAAEVRRRRIRVFDGHAAIAVLTAGRGASRRTIGALALDAKRAGGPDRGFTLFNAVNVVAATGGPGGMYGHSVYPESQAGSHGLLFEAGAAAHNLTESQFGLASVKFRWNVSGTYQQAVPRYVSTDAAGGDKREFLAGYFPDMGSLATAVFLKGYQWPFDARKAAGGSSLIDVLVHEETVVRGRRVFLDFRTDPDGGGRLEPFRPELLAPEARDYLDRSGALLPTPIARLERMNPPAVALYKAHGIDLRREPLEIAVCAQHNNGGFRGSIWWESNVRGLFPVGELCGTHGVTRPGGSALNAGQVGSGRAALFIARRRAGRPAAERDFARAAAPAVLKKWRQAGLWLGPGSGPALTPEACLAEVRSRMSACGAILRDPEEVRAAKDRARALWLRAGRGLRLASARDLARGFEALDLALTHAVYLEAIAEYLARGGKSRGSFLVPDPDGRPPHPLLGRRWAFSLAGPEDPVSERILEVRLDGRGRVVKEWVPVRPVPRPEDWFESVWADYRAGRIVVEED
ncbi:MAG TPA: FAD-binding protein [Candidatus Aminicenantes bacterium]|nr:FAD-binding protein [Candidatus Aminicenantes bacterium]HRY65801.1 FAD-binding protein [Candidatus Aminicenantes bacterium]HRZ72715.1 FAD-binding protein [Candidatus Aminicenantes bacterium]